MTISDYFTELLYIEGIMVALARLLVGKCELMQPATRLADIVMAWGIARLPTPTSQLRTIMYFSPSDVTSTKRGNTPNQVYWHRLLLFSLIVSPDRYIVGLGFRCWWLNLRDESINLSERCASSKILLSDAATPRDTIKISFRWVRLVSELEPLLL